MSLRLLPILAAILVAANAPLAGADSKPTFKTQESNERLAGFQSDKRSAWFESLKECKNGPASMNSLLAGIYSNLSWAGALHTADSRIKDGIKAIEESKEDRIAKSRELIACLRAAQDSLKEASFPYKDDLERDLRKAMTQAVELNTRLSKPSIAARPAEEAHTAPRN